MEIVKSTDEYTIVKKKSGRYGVKNAKGKWINAEKKVEVLLAEKLIKLTAAAPKQPEPVEEAAPTAEEAPAEETATE